MKVEQLYTGCLAEAAYYIESNGEAAIIDPLRETGPYIKMLEERGCKLAVTTEVDIATTSKNTRFIMPRLDTNDMPKNQNEKTNKYLQKPYKLFKTPI